MRARRRVLERSPDRSTFVIGLPLFFLSFLFVLLSLDPVAMIRSPEPTRVGDRAKYRVRFDIDRHVAHETHNDKSRIRNALLWLARHQFEDGSWSTYYFRQQCLPKHFCAGPGNPEHEVGATALVVLAFLESGLGRERIGEHDFEKIIKRALQWLASHQDAEGCFGARKGRYLYGHSLATLAYAKAYRVYGDRTYPHYIRSGVRFLEMARNPKLVWRYGIRDGRNDTSVTGWAGAALLEAKAAGIRVRPSAFKGISSWLYYVTEPRYYSVSYRRPGGGPSWARGLNESFKRTESLTAVALTLRLGMGVPTNSFIIREGINRLKRDLPTWDLPNETCVDFLYWYHGLKALSLYRKADAEGWKWWSKRVRSLLGKNQRKYTSVEDACLWGSWDPAGKWGREGGRVYATAINVLSMSLLLDR